MAEFHEETHFHTNGVQNPMETLKGTRPGVPLADVVYGFLMAKILKTIAQQMDIIDVLAKVLQMGINTWLRRTPLRGNSV